MHSVFGFGSKGLNVKSSKIDPININFVLFNTFPSRSEYSKINSFEKNSILPIYPNLFQAVTRTTHIFIWPYQKQDARIQAAARCGLGGWNEHDTNANLQTRVCKQPIKELSFLSDTVLKFHNLGPWFPSNKSHIHYLLNSCIVPSLYCTYCSTVVHKCSTVCMYLE